MAFDTPLQCDKPGNSLIMSFVTGPVLGSLMWVIGEGNKSKNNHNDHDVLQSRFQTMILQDDDEDDEENWMKSSEFELRDIQDGSKTKDTMVTSPPRMVQSDVSVTLDDGMDPACHQSLPRSLGESSWNNNMPIKRGKKKMSWSENLVEYMDESVRREPPQSSCGDSSPVLAKPMKSAMTRSASIRSCPLTGTNAGSGGSVEDTMTTAKERKIRYIPNFDRNHNSGLIMPTRPMGMMNSDPRGDGIESPQWGWYINTTPPTPEMYHSRSSLKHSGKSDNSASTSGTSYSSSADESSSAMRGPNRVFQGLKAGSNRPPMGWPSVPL